MKRKSDQLEEPFDRRLDQKIVTKRTRDNNQKSTTTNAIHFELEISGSPLIFHDEKSADTSGDLFLDSWYKQRQTRSNGLSESPIQEEQKTSSNINLSNVLENISQGGTERGSNRSTMSFKDFKDARRIAKLSKKDDNATNRISDIFPQINSILRNLSTPESSEERKNRRRERQQSQKFLMPLSKGPLFQPGQLGNNPLQSKIDQTPSSHSGSRSSLENQNQIAPQKLSFVPQLNATHTSNEPKNISSTLDLHNRTDFYGASDLMNSSFLTGSFPDTSKFQHSPNLTLMSEIKPKETPDTIEQPTNPFSMNSVDTSIMNKGMILSRLGRKGSITPTIENTRRSFSRSHSKSPIVEKSKKEDPRQDSNRKSMGSKSVDVSIYKEVQEENEKLKKEVQRKTKESENLKREKEVLLRKVKSVENEKRGLEEENNTQFEEIRRQEEMMTQMREELSRANYLRANLHNYLQELRGNLRVFCRIKPIDPSSKRSISLPDKNSSNEGVIQCVEVGSGPKKNTFYFDRVFEEQASNQEIFDEIQPFIQSAIDGDHVCILAYGQTGSGKTYTMEGPNLQASREIKENSGILPRAVDFIFKERKRLKLHGIQIELQLACLEIYNENLTDLLGDPSSLNNSLNTSNSSMQTSDKDGKLAIHYSSNKVIINNITWVSIHDTEQLFTLMNKASKARATDKTTQNEASSRSHCIYRLRLVQGKGKEGLLTVVDLAGSERSDPGQHTGDKSFVDSNQLKKIQNEANFINKSLTTLGRIVRLVNEKKNTNLPYRESKLTRILQDSLGGNAKTLMFINICPSEENAFQSKESLKFSSKVSF